jgi:uncharacterized membrane protein
MRFAPRQGRFLITFAVGAATGLAAWALGVDLVFSLLIGVDVFFVLYLAVMAWLAHVADAEELRRHAEEDDEGVALILLLALIAVVASITAIFLVLTADESSLLARSSALISLPLGWASLHVMAAFHYAHLHYRSKEAGMVFPGKGGDPDALDFLYASFTIGMTAQISDVQIASRPLRRAVLVHGIASFFYNTGILALAVNAAVSAGQ